MFNMIEASGILKIHELLGNAIHSDNLDYVKEQLDKIYDILKENILGKEEESK